MTAPPARSHSYWRGEYHRDGREEEEEEGPAVQSSSRSDPFLNNFGPSGFMADGGDRVRREGSIPSIMTASKVSNLYSARFQTRWLTYELKFHGFELLTFGQIENAMGRDFTNLLKDVESYYTSANTQTSVIFKHENIVSGQIGLPFVDTTALSADYLADVLSRAMDSNKNLNLSDMITVEFTSKALPPLGLGRLAKTRHAVRDEHAFIGRLRCSINPNLTYPRDNGLCLSASLYLSVLYASGPEDQGDDEDDEDEEPQAQLFGPKAVRRIQRRPDQLRDRAVQLLVQSNLEPGPMGVEALAVMQNVDQLANVSIGAFDAQGKRIFFANRGPGSVYACVVLSKNRDEQTGHWWVLTKPSALQGCRQHCRLCGLGYDHGHKCSASGCRVCKRPLCTSRPEDFLDKSVKFPCENCQLVFRSAACLEIHTCGEWLKCIRCNTVCHKTGFRADGEHKNCGMRRCVTCAAFVERGKHEFCYIQKFTPNPADLMGPRRVEAELEWNPMLHRNKPVPDAARLVFYDFECIKVNGRLIDILCVLVTGDEEADVHYFWTDNRSSSAEKMIDYIVGQEEFKRRKTIFIAHNAAKFDVYYLLAACQSMRTDVKICAVEQKIIDVQICGTKARLRDSFLYLPLSLRNLERSFREELRGMGKSYFPMGRLLRENVGMTFPFPEPAEFGRDKMTDEEKANFDEWYEAERRANGDWYHFDEMLQKYCLRDVLTLKICCNTFAELFGEIVGLNIFSVAPTAASAMGKVYRDQFLPDDKTIVNEPQIGYCDQQAVSQLSKLYLSYLEETYPGITDMRREVNVGDRRRVDSWFTVAAPIDHPKLRQFPAGADVILEINGCKWHGCDDCLHEMSVNPLTGVSNAEMQRRQKERIRQIQRDCPRANVVAIKECEIREEIEENRQLADYFKRKDAIVSLKPRDAFKGGNTTAYRRFVDLRGRQDFEILFLDLISLYPAINATALYGYGPPTIRRNVPVEQARFDQPGIWLLTVVPPEDHFYPVLPIRTADQRLVFALCTKCAETQNQSICECDEEDRQITGTYCSIEIQKAVDNGYRVKKIHESWTYEQSSRELFRPFILKFFTLKLKSSGFPSHVVTDQQKLDYCDFLNVRLGTRLTPQDISYNNGKRLVAKTSLNSFWGRFGLRPSTSGVTICRTNESLIREFTTPNQEVMNINLLTADSILVITRNIKKTARSIPHTSLNIAATTTAAARMRLQECLELIEPSNMIYCDTDSVLFLHKKGEELPRGLRLGNWMGDWAPEPYSSKITRYCASGAKSYCFTYTTEDGREETCFKMKGLTLKGEGAGLNREEFENLVLDNRDDQKIILSDPNLIRRDIKNLRINVKEAAFKSLRVTAGNKRFFIKNPRRAGAGDNLLTLDSAPFGYRPSRNEDLAGPLAAILDDQEEEEEEDEQEEVEQEEVGRGRVNYYDRPGPSNRPHHYL